MDTNTETATVETGLDEQGSEIVRLEPNVEELPIFSAAKRSRRSQEAVTLTWRDSDPLTKRPITKKITLRPAAGLGLPAERERDLYYLVIAPFIEREGFGERGTVGPIRYNDACRLMGWTRTGPNYRQVLEAVKTMALLGVEMENAVLDGKTRKLAGYAGHLMDALFYEESEARRAKEGGTEYKLKRGEFFLIPADWFRENHLNRYLKPLDLAPYRLLRSSIAKALYGYLDKQAHRARYQTEPELRLDLHELRERFRLTTTKTFHLVQEFKRAHAELLRSWPALRSAAVEKVSPGRYEAVYRFTNQTELPLEGTPEAQGAGERGPRRPMEEAAVDVLAQELMLAGVRPSAATRLVHKHDAARIRARLDELRQLRQREDIKNPGGWLREHIEDDVPPFDGYKSPDQQAREEQTRTAYQDKRAQERKERELLLAKRAGMSVEELVDEELELQIRHYQLMAGGEYPPEEWRRERVAALHARFTAERQSGGELSTGEPAAATEAGD